MDASRGLYDLGNCHLRVGENYWFVAPRVAVPTPAAAESALGATTCARQPTRGPRPTRDIKGRAFRLAGTALVG